MLNVCVCVCVCGWGGRDLQQHIFVGNKEKFARGLYFLSFHLFFSLCPLNIFEFLEPVDG